MREWSIGREFQEAELQLISEGVFQHGRAQAVGGNPAPLACLVREGGKIIAGASGRTEFERLFIQYLWVDSSYRGQGLGSEVLRKLEIAARQASCKDCIIETLDDRVAQLYERLGYRPLAIIPSYVGPFNRHILHKKLVVQGSEL